jgi:MarR family transcriptional regulator, transcriptional regulator for hemolysin
VSRAFDDALAAEGGSLPTWLILLNLKTRSVASQRELAEAVGIREATLTHHLTAMETAGLVTRRRDSSNRRIQLVELTASGENAFLRMRGTAMSFDQRLRAGIAAEQIDELEAILRQLAVNVGAGGTGPPWQGLAESGS